MKDFQYITSSHPQYIEQLYQDFVKDPLSVDAEMKKFFEGFDFAVQSGYQPNGQITAERPGALPEAGIDWRKEIGAYRLILGYRNRAHLLSKTNPIRKRKDRGARLELENFGLSDADLDNKIHAAELVGLKNGTLRQLVDHLQKSYAGHVGIEFKYIVQKEKVDFLVKAMEQDFHQPFPIEKRKRILEKLNQGVLFERFLHTKYIGQKRFSLEGGETTIAALDAIINTAAEGGVRYGPPRPTQRTGQCHGQDLRTDLQRIRRNRSARSNHGQRRRKISHGLRQRAQNTPRQFHSRQVDAEPLAPGSREPRGHRLRACKIRSPPSTRIQ